jgi:chemotaxis protein MotB
MARRHKHEEHANHEAWAIPYGDLITLLLAFFVVMYAMSSVNEGKYRVLSDSLVAAFRGSPRTLDPVQVGEKQVGSGADINMSIVQQAMLEGQPREMLEPSPIRVSDVARTDTRQASEGTYESEAHHNAAAMQELENVADEVERAMSGLIDEQLIVVRRHGLWVEVEIRTDILFPSGVATLSANATNVLQQLAQTLQPFPNPIRVEGHTDNRPISTRAFPSNWELSSARAASVVHLFTQVGLAPARLAVIGLGEYRPSQSNATPEGRNANRRVLLVILSGNGMPEGDYADDRGKPEVQPASPPADAAPEQGAPVQQFTAPPPTIEASLTPASAVPVIPKLTSP